MHANKTEKKEYTQEIKLKYHITDLLHGLFGFLM
jgi:hypothetical protein